MKNPIIEEVREAREALAAERGYDRHRILEWAKKQHASRQKTVKQMSPNNKGRIAAQRSGASNDAIG